MFQVLLIESPHLFGNSLSILILYVGGLYKYSRRRVVVQVIQKRFHFRHVWPRITHDDRVLLRSLNISL